MPATRCVQTGKYFIWQLAVATSRRLVYRIDVAESAHLPRSRGVLQRTDRQIKEKLCYLPTEINVQPYHNVADSEDRGSQFLWNDDTQQTIPFTVYSVTDPTGV